MVAAAVWFKCLGGKWRNLAPSNLFEVGSFGFKKGSIQTNKYANSEMRKALQAFGEKFGCHSCGIRRSWTVSSLWKNSPGKNWTFHGDHQPPLKFASKSTLCRLYPQCPSCSSKQAAAVRSGKGKLVLPSFLSCRAYHFWLPWPLLSDPVMHYIVPIIKHFQSLL